MSNRNDRDKSNVVPISKWRNSPKILRVKRTKKRRGWLYLLFFFLFAAAVSSFLSPARIVEVVELNPDFVRVIDADTIAVESTSIRLKGIAAPEKGHPSYDKGRTFLGKLLRQSTKVECHLTSERTHGRRVGRCSFEMESGDIVDIQKTTVNAGYARGCPRHGGWRYWLDETPVSKTLPFPDYCWGFSIH